MKRIYILSTMLLVFISVIAPTVANEADWLPDANLRTAVRSALSIADDAALTQEDMQDLTAFTAVNSQISDITGLEHATALTFLDVRDNSITDVGPLSALTHLEALRLKGNTLSDISPLSGLTNLTLLNLKGTGISSVSVLSGLTHLAHLRVDDNSLTDVEPLTSLTNLRKLWIAGNALTNAHLLSSLTNLTTLDIEIPDPPDTTAPDVRISVPSEVQTGAFDVMITFTEGVSEFDREDLSLGGTASADITAWNMTDNTVYTVTITPTTSGTVILDIPADVATDAAANGNTVAATQTVTVELGSPAILIPNANLAAAIRTRLKLVADADITAADMQRLTRLWVSNLGISNLTGLEHATNLTTLYLSQNEISDISALAELTNLTRLDLSNNNISDISTLANLTNLTELSLDLNGISDISTLANLTNLTTLYLHNNNISDISALAELTNLRGLHLYANNISDISALAELTTLTELYLRNNQISDISALANLTNLRGLYLHNNNISDISALANLTTLTELYLRNNQISDISALANLTNLRGLYLHNNNISDISALANLTNLTTLYLRNNQILDTSPIYPLLGANGVSLNVDIPVSQYPPWDVNEDGSVDATDSALVTAALGETGNGIANGRTDVNKDGTVDADDLTLVTDNLDPGTVVDVTRLDVSISVPVDVQSSAFDATITFSEAVLNFDQGDVSLSGTATASITSWVATPENKVFTATITPTTSGTVILDIPADVATDTANNPNTAATSQTVTVTIADPQEPIVDQEDGNDTLAPDVNISVPTVPQNGAFDVIITFTEAVSEFVPADLLLGGTATADITAWNKTDTTVFTAEITPTTSGELTLDIDADVATDAASNGNTPATQQTVTVDIDAPSVTLTLLPEPDVDYSWNRIDVQITFSEPVEGFESTDVQITTSGLTAIDLPEFPGEIPAIASITGWTPHTDGKTYTVYITTYTQTDGQVIVNVPADVAIDAASNGNTAATQLSVDEERAFYIFFSPSSDNSGCHVSSFWATPQETLRKALDVDEDGDIDADDVTLVRNALGQSGDGILNKRTDINCDEIVDDTDLALVNDTDPPTPTLSVPTGDQSERFTIDISFEEVVYDFDPTDVVFTEDSTAEATIANYGRSGPGRSGRNTYTFSVTPTTSGDLVISVPADVTEDALGNKNTASAEKTVTIDLTIPKVALSFSRTDGDPSEMTVTITFSEVVSGFDQADLSVSGYAGTPRPGGGVNLTPITTTSIISWETTDNTVFTAKIKSDTSGQVLVHVPAGVATDADGNTNTASSRHSYDVDLDSPTVTVSVPTDTQSRAFDITIYFNEGVYDFDQTDVSLAGSTATATITDWESLTASEVWVSGGGDVANRSTYQATITPTTGGTVTISIPADVAHDSFGNKNTASDSYTVTVSLPGGNAPSAVLSQVMELLDTTSLESLNLEQLEVQLQILRAESDGSLKYLQALALLENTLAAMRPDKTLLLANYPNPFNPETWIPYHLANPSNVRITIYDVRGTVVRQLDLGHQREGYYTNRSRAAYWDGRNTFGEPVASGIYFYQLDADNMSLLRKMLILK